MKCLAVPCALIALSALLPAQAPAHWHGVPYTLPDGWTSRLADGVLLLLPPARGAEAGGVFGFVHDPEVRSLDSEQALEALASAAEELVPGAQREGKARARTFGALAGKTFLFRGRDAQRRKVEVRFHAFPAQSGHAALFEVGRAAELKVHDDAVSALLDSLGKPPAPATDSRPSRLGDGAAAGKPEATPRPVVATERDRTWNGVVFALPRKWRTESGDDGALVLVPPDANPNGLLEELHALVCDGTVATIDAPEVPRVLQAALDAIQPGMKLADAGKVDDSGALPARRLRYVGVASDGRKIEARFHAFPSRKGAAALLSFGYTSALAARETELDSVVGSLRAQPKGAAGGRVPAELAGTWTYFASVQANDGGGRSNGASLTLRTDGTYLYSAENCSTNPFGAAWGNERDSGTWEVEGDRITFHSASGEQATYGLEKRNHPKNRQDPMLVFDGKCFVTATQRRPW